MDWVLIGIGWLLLLAFLAKFFRTVHKWDEEIEKMSPTQKDILIDAMHKASEAIDKGPNV